MRITKANGDIIECSAEEFNKLNDVVVRNVSVQENSFKNPVVDVPVHEISVVRGRKKGHLSWSKDELQCLRDNQYMHISDLRKLFPDKAGSTIYDCMKRLGISRGNSKRVFKNRKVGVSPSAWSKSDVKLLRDNKDKHISVLVDMFGKPAWSVYKCLSKHHIKRSRIDSTPVKRSGKYSARFSKSDIKLLRANADKHISELQKMFPNNAVSSIYNCMLRNHIKRKTVRLDKIVARDWSCPVSKPVSFNRSRKWSRVDVKLLKENSGKHMSELRKIFPDRRACNIYGALRKYKINRGRVDLPNNGKRGGVDSYKGNRAMMNFMNARAKVLIADGIDRNKALSQAGKEWKIQKNNVFIGLPDSSVPVVHVVSQDNVSRRNFLDSRMKYLMDVNMLSRENALQLASMEWDKKSTKVFPNFDFLSPVFGNNLDSFISFIKGVVFNNVQLSNGNLAGWMGVVSIEQDFFESFIISFLQESQIISKYFGVDNKFRIIEKFGEKYLVYNGVLQ